MKISACVLLLVSVAVFSGLTAVSQGGEPSVAQGKDASPSDIAASSQDISRWVEQLDSDQFDQRERAQAKLTAAGSPAMPEIAAAARTASLESSTRAINILLTWSEGNDRRLAVAALEQLASMKNRPIESARAAEVLAEVRELAALEAVVSLGGSYQVNPQLRGVISFVPTVNYQIIIGSKWRGGLESLQLLESIPHTAVVSFYAPPLDDDALDCLQNLPQLGRVELYGTRFSKEAIEELPRKLPNVKEIDIRPSAAFLGIRGDGGQNAHVVDVVPDSAAAKGGIRKEDVITHIAGKEVKDFAALTAMISQYQPGETVELTIVRRGGDQELQTMELPVTLAQWGPTSNDTLPELRKMNLERR
ncbi:PDZ domain-containing protein [Bythopirellula goksoeyrii]|uniref:Periplasmic pH-dependent serine endoprotease DegQ n=1 Tax=Bythopirellula goksoeyrii TaxID=1400387 RepID=A0A5B9Q8H2_9BACT|nr:PDZ domain-containing protein [Bythopirellula goksoeyrii]QEG35374.1 Periplasmic pH-dependent serine endoprotease DegQ precursor [Bythopirellula goksoeyrii]